jgi:hypothetical protein
MKTLKNGPLAAWSKVEPGQVLDFRSSKPRHVKFQVTANSAIEIWAGSDSEMTDSILIGCGNEKLQVEYTATGDSYVMIKAEKKSAIYVNIPDLDQNVQESELPSFTSIEPRVRNNTEVDRMMQLMKLNEKRRDAELAAERAVLRAEMAKLGQAAETVAAAEQVIENEVEEVNDDNGVEAST